MISKLEIFLKCSDLSRPGEICRRSRALRWPSLRQPVRAARREGRGGAEPHTQQIHAGEAAKAFRVSIARVSFLDPVWF